MRIKWKWQNIYSFLVSISFFTTEPFIDMWMESLSMYNSNSQLNKNNEGQFFFRIYHTFVFCSSYTCTKYSKFVANLQYMPVFLFYYVYSHFLFSYSIVLMLLYAVSTVTRIPLSMPIDVNQSWRVSKVFIRLAGKHVHNKMQLNISNNQYPFQIGCDDYRTESK